MNRIPYIILTGFVGLIAVVFVMITIKFILDLARPVISLFITDSNNYELGVVLGELTFQLIMVALFAFLTRLLFRFTKYCWNCSKL
jgi:hypothetical protein